MPENSPAVNDAVVVLDYLNEKSGRSYRPTPSNLRFISARLAESGVDVDGCKAMIRHQVTLWAGTDMAFYLRPETLFNATKFDGYYAMRDVDMTPARQSLAKQPDETQHEWEMRLDRIK